MEQQKRRLVLDAFENRATERVPVGFWFHFTRGDEVFRGLEDPSIARKSVAGHLRFYEEFHPDLIKIMSDGFFRYPHPALAGEVTGAALAAMAPLGADHPWITAQVALVRELTSVFGKDICSFYNIFGPATTLRILFGDGAVGNKKLADLIVTDPAAARHALDAVASDLSALAERVIAEGGADGVYVSVQSIQDVRVSDETYREIVAPSELALLKRANAARDLNILHVCGYEGSRNNLRLFADYPSKAVNWATAVEGIGLAEGKRLFGGRAVIGGFGNSADGLLARGARAEIESHTASLIAETGGLGVIVGADCTVPPDIDVRRFDWVREAARKRH